MRICILDRDRASAHFLVEQLTLLGHEVIVEQSKQAAMQRLETERFDIALIDPAPLPTAKPMALQLRWKNRENYLFLMLLTHDSENAEVIRAGLNDYIAKPLRLEDVKKKIGNAVRLINFYDKLMNDDDIRTQGVVFGKKPIAQLLLSALDRTYRYEEQAFLLNIEVENYHQIAEQYGEEVRDKVMGQVSDYLTQIRRMSDFLSRSDHHEFSLLMQRPEAESEASDAARRFVIALQEYQNGDLPRATFRIRLFELPMAHEHLDVHLDEQGQEKAHAA